MILVQCYYSYVSISTIFKKDLEKVRLLLIKYDILYKTILKNNITYFIIDNINTLEGNNILNCCILNKLIELNIYILADTSWYSSMKYKMDIHKGCYHLFDLSITLEKINLTNIIDVKII